VKLIERLQLHF